MTTQRRSDRTVAPEAVKRHRVQTIKLYAGLVIAAAGLAAVFLYEALYVGFGVAMIGTGLVPFEAVAARFFK